jgi:putative peptidoglycan lipid II flippase
MVRSFLSVVNREVRGMHQAAYVLAAFALGSQVLALLRDRLLAATFGASHTLDIYYAAFRVPDTLFATVASLLSLYALLPALSRLERQGEGLMVSFLQQSLVVFFVAMSGIALVLWILAPWFMPLIAPGIAGPQLVLLARILLLQPIFLGASNILGSMTQLRHRFFLYSLSPVLYNLGIIFGVVVLYPHLGIAGLGWGVVLGAISHALIQVPAFLEEKRSPLSIPMMLKELRFVLELSVPRTLALAANQISLLALTAIASLLSSGTITVFTFAYNLQAVPLTIIGTSYSIAAFPTLARLHAAGNHTEFGSYLETALRHIFFWSIPATIFTIVLRAQLVRVILGAGAFDWSATRLTAAALALFVVSLAAQSATLLIARAYYAIGDSRKPLYWGVIDVVVSIIAALLFLGLFHESVFLRTFIESLLRVDDLPGTSVLMLAAAYALGSITEFAVGMVVFMRDFKLSTRRFGALCFQSFSASVIGASATYLVLATTGAAGTVNTTLQLIVQGVSASILGLCIAAGLLILLKNQELAEAGAALHRRFTRKDTVPLEITDVSS